MDTVPFHDYIKIFDRASHTQINIHRYWTVQYKSYRTLLLTVHKKLYPLSIINCKYCTA